MRGGGMMEEEKKKDSEETPEETTQEKEEEIEEDDEDLFSDEEDEYDEEEGSTWENARNWVQDNLRVILSVLIVVLIAVGIYNYSGNSRDENQSRIDELIGEQNVEIEEEQKPEEEISVKDKEEKDNQVVVKEEQKEAAPEQKVETKAEKSAEGYTVQAASGDGTTHLARKAFREYLAANPDAGITKEHKIYIEDYLSKKVGARRLNVGDSQVFSETLLKEAVSQAKQLSPKQLENLKYYSARVSGL